MQCFNSSEKTIINTENIKCHYDIGAFSSINNVSNKTRGTILDSILMELLL